MISVFLTFEQSLVYVRMSRDKRTYTIGLSKQKKQKTYDTLATAGFIRTGSRLYGVCLQARGENYEIIIVAGMRLCFVIYPLPKTEIQELQFSFQNVTLCMSSNYQQ